MLDVLSFCNRERTWSKDKSANFSGEKKED